MSILRGLFGIEEGTFLDGTIPHGPKPKKVRGGSRTLERKMNLVGKQKKINAAAMKAHAALAAKSHGQAIKAGMSQPKLNINAVKQAITSLKPAHAATLKAALTSQPKVATKAITALAALHPVTAAAIVHHVASLPPVHATRAIAQLAKAPLKMASTMLHPSMLHGLDDDGQLPEANDPNAVIDDAAQQAAADSNIGPDGNPITGTDQWGVPAGHIPDGLRDPNGPSAWITQDLWELWPDHSVPHFNGVRGKFRLAFPVVDNSGAQKYVSNKSTVIPESYDWTSSGPVFHRYANAPTLRPFYNDDGLSFWAQANMHYSDPYDQTFFFYEHGKGPGEFRYTRAPAEFWRADTMDGSPEYYYPAGYPIDALDYYNGGMLPDELSSLVLDQSYAYYLNANGYTSGQPLTAEMFWKSILRQYGIFGIPAGWGSGLGGVTIYGSADIPQRLGTGAVQPLPPPVITPTPEHTQDSFETTNDQGSASDSGHPLPQDGSIIQSPDGNLYDANTGEMVQSASGQSGGGGGWGQSVPESQLAPTSDESGMPSASDMQFAAEADGVVPDQGFITDQGQPEFDPGAFSIEAGGRVADASMMQNAEYHMADPGSFDNPEIDYSDNADQGSDYFDQSEFPMVEDGQGSSDGSEGYDTGTTTPKSEESW